MRHSLQFNQNVDHPQDSSYGGRKRFRSGDTISEIEDEAYNILDVISSYHSTRGNYVVQVGGIGGDSM